MSERYIEPCRLQLISPTLRNDFDVFWQLYHFFEVRDLPTGPVSLQSVFMNK